VPDNLFIIGTMNTADRSVEALDTALRRRFVFEEINPIPEILSDIDVLDIDFQVLLETINERIEILVDRDHCIGHSYFLKLKSTDVPENKLHNIFYNEIIPLLQEYFYGDYGK